MVAIHSDSVNQRVLEVTSRTIGSNNWFWVGLERNEVGGFRWTDGSGIVKIFTPTVAAGLCECYSI